jgi:hypothetical protein
MIDQELASKALPLSLPFKKEYCWPHHVSDVSSTVHGNGDTRIICLLLVLLSSSRSNNFDGLGRLG